MQHRSGAANFVEAGLTKRHTTQRKASGAATAEQHMSYAYPALAPSRAVATQGIPRGGLCERERVANMLHLLGPPWPPTQCVAFGLTFTITPR